MFISSSVAGQGGFEPTTPGFGDRCSANWSYWPTTLLFNFLMKCMLSIKTAIFFQLNFCRIVFLVLSSTVIFSFTLSTL